jgi:superfamily II DNA helicase RecQ
VPTDVDLSGAAVAAEKALRDWRTKRARADEVPAYVVLNDRHLRGIAVAKPRDAAELAACDGIGPAKLERYGDEILDVLSAL